MTLGDVYERLPFFTKGTSPAKILATDVYLFTSSALAGSITLLQGVDPNTQGVSIGPGPDAGTMKSFVATNIEQIPMCKWQLAISGVTTPLDQLWLVARYTLGS